MKLSNELKIGITALVAIVVAFLGYRVMRDVPLFKTSTTLYTNFDDVSGLLSGSNISFKGFKIGSVKDRELLSNDSIRVTLNIDEGVRIPRGSVAYLKSPGVLGAKFIEIVKSDNDQLLKNEDTIKGVFEKGMMDTFAEEGSQLSKEITSSIQGVEALIDNLNGTLTEDNQQNVGEALNGLAKMTNDLQTLVKDKKGDLSKIISDAQKTMGNFAELSSENKDELNSLIVNLEKASQNLDSLSIGLNQTTLSLNSILQKIDNGEGTLGMMVTDSSLYNNLDSLSFNLNELVKNIQSDPKKYLKYMRLIEVF